MTAALGEGTTGLRLLWASARSGEGLGSALRIGQYGPAPASMIGCQSGDLRVWVELRGLNP